MSRRSCDDLGLCQGLTPPCKGCTLPARYRTAFAPGVIEHHRRQHGKHLVRWMLRAMVITALAMTVVGLLKGGMQ